MTLKEAVAIAIEETTLLDAQAWICKWDSERVIAQCGGDTRFKECLRAVELAWHNKNPVGWPTSPLRHEMLGEKKWRKTRYWENG